MHLPTLLTLLPLAAALPATSLASRQQNWPACQSTLSCTFWDIESASIQARLDYVQAMQAQRFGPLNATDRFRAIEGVLQFFLGENLG